MNAAKPPGEAAGEMTPGSAKPSDPAAKPPGEAAGEMIPGSAKPSAPKRGAVFWHGRFEAGPADELLAFTVSLPFDQRLAPDDIAGSRAHVRGLARIGILTDAERDEVLAALDQVEHELTEGAFRVRADRRGHPHRGGAPRHRAGACRRQAPHRSQPQRSGRDRPAPVHEARAAGGGPAGRGPARGAARSGGRGRRCLPARLHAPAARPAGHPGPPPPRPRLGVGARRRPAARRQRLGPMSPRWAPGRWPARPSRSTPTAWPRTSGSRHGSRTASTRCRTATSSPSRCSPSPWWASTCRASARSSCSGHRTSSASPRSTMRSRPAAR